MSLPKMRFIAFVALGLCLLFVPDFAHASSSLNELSSGFEKFLGWITGSLARWIIVGAIAIVGLQLAVNHQELTGPIKMMLSVILAACLVVFAIQIVDTLFSFSGALL